jgi:hypothetical protein
MDMKKWKAGFLGALALLVVSNLFWVYVFIDQAVSYSYLQESMADKENSISVMGELLVEAGKDYGQKDVLHLLRLKYPDDFIVEEGDKIIMGNVFFLFKNDKLAAVQ